MYTLMCWEAFYWVESAEPRSWGSAGLALLGIDDVSPGTWTHPLGALNPFPGADGRKEKGSVKVYRAAFSPPHTLPWRGPSSKGQARPRLIMTLGRV